MADIYEPEPTSSFGTRSDSVKRPLFATLVTAIVGFAALAVGLVFLALYNFALSLGATMFMLFVGFANTLLGVLDIYVAYNIWNLKYDSRYFGVVANVGLIILNLFSFNIGIVGVGLVIVSLFALLLLDTSQS